MKRKLLDLNDALGVSYYRRLCSDWLEVLQRVRAATHQAQPPVSFFDALTHEERSLMRIMSAISDMAAVVDGLRVVRILMNRTPPKDYLHKHELSVADYMSYHYSSFLHRVSTVLDMMKIVTNEALQLGLPHEQCTWAILEKRQKFKDSEARDIIAAYHSEFLGTIERRQKNTHRGILEHEPLSRLGGELLVMASARKYDVASRAELESFLRPVYLDWKTRSVRTSIVVEITQSEQRILKHIQDLLSSFEPPVKGDTPTAR